MLTSLNALRIMGHTPIALYHTSMIFQLYVLPRVRRIRGKNKSDKTERFKNSKVGAIYSNEDTGKKGLRVLAPFKLKH